ncbi:hypothetical protein ACFFJI_04200 [Allobacillus sp. GCM10007491]|uniref:Uncharacterized protein n=2 Tax=Allobacillus TaxID=1400133 RepID=A0A941CUC1_9BACI|nr:MULTISPECIES: hypothetical protein [Allobacillus]MBR7553977.1 hypothetical protein [Allobacillus saliphilus]TSJ60062.1 hypothetical protein FPQ13_12375 [Allobacillus salarius]
MAKRKVNLAVVLVLYMILFSIPFYLDIYYQTFYYVFISTLFLVTMIFEFEEKAVTEERFYRKWKKTRKRGVVFFALKEWLKTIGSIIFFLVFGKMIESGIPFLQALREYAGVWWLILLLGTILAMILIFVGWHEKNEKYIRIHSKINT